MYDGLSRRAFELSFVAALYVAGIVLWSIWEAGKYSMTPEPYWPWAVGISFVAFAYAAMDTINATRSAHGDEVTRIENLQSQINGARGFLWWGSPLGWLGLFFLWVTKKSPIMCLAALVVLLYLLEDDKKMS